MKPSWKTCFKIGVCVFLLFLCIHYVNTAERLLLLFIGALAPIIIGLVIAYILNILMNFYERHYFPKHSEKKFIAKSRHPICLICSLLTACAIIALVIGLVIPELISCVKFLVLEIPPIAEKIANSELVAKILPADIEAQLAKMDFESYISKAAQFLASGIGNAADAVVTVVSSTVSTIVTATIGVVFAIYLLSGKDRLRLQCKRLIRSYLRPRWTEKLLYFFNVLNESFKGYIVGQCTEAVILWILCTLGMLLFRFPYAAMIGALVGFTALIPIAGAYIGAGVGALMILTESPLKALLFLVFIVVLQQLEGNLIYPKVVGKSLGLPAVWVLAAVTIGAGIYGILGMLIGVPVTAAIYRIIKEDTARREALEPVDSEQVN